MARVRKVENLTISVQNVISELAEIPLNNVVMMLAAGAAAIPTTEYTISGTTITWDEVTAGYDLEVGEVVVVDYEYEDGTSDADVPYDETSSDANPVFVSYEMTVAEENIVPKLIHVPVTSTLIVRVNGSPTTVDVDWTRNGKNLTWISGTTLNVSDTVYVEYRRSA